LTALLYQCKTSGVVAKRPRVLTLSAKESLILELLVHQQEMYGLQLVASSKRRLKRGTVYVTLGRMEAKGYLISRLEDAPPQAGGLPRRVYEATPLGRRVLTHWTEAGQVLMPEFAR
jgi:DNA-binding PadR family transcriptional regulator